MHDPDRLIRQARTRLEEARTLLAAGLDEGSVARAYYAAFTAARAMLAADGAFPKTHAGVLHEFGKRYVKPGIVEPGLHTTLARLESKRNLADYGSGGAIGRSDATSALLGAEALIQAAVAYVRQS